MRSGRPPLSVVTPSFNQARYIRRTIESVLSQGIEALEYVIFDGGSRDGTAAILAEYASRVRVTIAPDAGQADAVNKGLAASTGEVIGWLNSDDVYYPGACAAALAAMAAHPEADVVYGRANHIDEHDAVIDAYETEPFDYERLKDVCFICQPAAFFRRRTVETFGPLRADLHYCMDYEFWLRVCAERAPVFVDRVLAGSRLHDATKTLGQRDAVHREIVTMLRERFGAPPDRWIYNLAHVLAESAGFSRDTLAGNAAFVVHLSAIARQLFVEYCGAVPPSGRAQLAQWLRHARQLRRLAPAEPA